MASLYVCFLSTAKYFPDLMAILLHETEPFCEMRVQCSSQSIVTSEGWGYL